MTDNARIVREVIEFREKWFPHPQTEAALTALAALETELATTKSELERAREEERERIIGIITDPHNNILWVVPGSSRVQAIHADPRMIRAALAPEQKG